MDWTRDTVANKSNKVYLSDLVEMVELTPEYKPLRMVGPSRKVAVHNLRITAGKKGGPTREVGIPKLCLAWNEESKEFDKGPCPYCDVDPKTPGFIVYTNVIDRELQETLRLKPLSESERKVVSMSGYKCRVVKDKSSKNKTPARLLRITSSAGTKLSDLTSMNKKKGPDGEKKPFPPQDPKHGFDINMRFDKNKESASDMYGVLKHENTALTEEERKYALWDINTEQPESLKEAKANAKDLASKLVNKKEGADDEDEAPKKGAKKNKNSPESDDWDENEDFEDYDDAPKKKKKKPVDDDDDDDDRPAKKKKKRPADDDDDDEDDADVDWDDEDDDEDEKPAKKKKRKPADDDEDEDEDEDDAPKKKKGAAKKKRPADDDDEDEDEDERPAKKKKKKPDPDEDDDDDDWGDDDEDEDEAPKKKKRKPVEDDEDDEDERPAKKKKKKPVDDDDDDEDARERPKKKKRKPVEDDEDEDDDDEDW